MPYQMDLIKCVDDIASFYPIMDEVEINGVRLRHLLNFRSVYKHIKDLGRGAFGTVKCYKERATNNYYAFKEVIINKNTNIEKLQQEVSILYNLSHNNKSIVQYYDSFIYTNRKKSKVIYVIVTEYISGFTLYDYIDTLITENKFAPTTTIFNLSLWLFSTLSYIHDAGYVHRDIKPENIMIDDKHKRFVLLDFGLTCSSEDISSSKQGKMVGTPDFIAPERWDLSKLSRKSSSPRTNDTLSIWKKSDVWSAGVTIYELVEQRLPWIVDRQEFHYSNSKYNEDNHLEALLSLQKQITGSYPIEYTCPIPNIVSIMRMCLNRDPNLRPSSDHVLIQMKDMFYETSSSNNILHFSDLYDDTSNIIFIPHLDFGSDVITSPIRSPKQNLTSTSPSRYTPPESPRSVEPPKKKHIHRPDFIFTIIRRFH